MWPVSQLHTPLVQKKKRAEYTEDGEEFVVSIAKGQGYLSTSAGRLRYCGVWVPKHSNPDSKVEGKTKQDMESKPRVARR